MVLRNILEYLLLEENGEEISFELLSLMAYIQETILK